MTVDYSVNLGNLLTILAFLAGGVAFAYTIKSQVGFLGLRLDKLETEIRKLSDILIKLGRQDERLNAMDRRIDELRHGRGFVLEEILDGQQTRNNKASRVSEL